MVYGWRVSCEQVPSIREGYVDTALLFEDERELLPLDMAPTAPSKFVFAHGTTEDAAWRKVERYVAKTSFENIEDRIILH